MDRPASDTPAAAPITTEREAFEVWEQCNRYEVGHQGSGGEYLGHATAIAWEAWQARAALSAPMATPLTPERGTFEAALNALPPLPQNEKLQQLLATSSPWEKPAAQPAVSGVNAQWVEQLANKARRAWAINPPSIEVLTQEMREIDEALRTHLSPALGG